MGAKPLVWREPTDHPQDYEDSCILLADGIGGKYHISPKQKVGAPYLLWWAHDEFIWEGCASIEDAMAKAEADWQTRYATLQATPEKSS